jgi:hypothetical protein
MFFVVKNEELFKTLSDMLEGRGRAVPGQVTARAQPNLA